MVMSVFFFQICRYGFHFDIHHSKISFSFLTNYKKNLFAQTLATFTTQYHFPLYSAHKDRNKIAQLFPLKANVLHPEKFLIFPTANTLSFFHTPKRSSFFIWFAISPFIVAVFPAIRDPLPGKWQQQKLRIPRR